MLRFCSILIKKLIITNQHCLEILKALDYFMSLKTSLLMHRKPTYYRYLRRISNISSGSVTGDSRCIAVLQYKKRQNVLQSDSRFVN